MSDFISDEEMQKHLQSGNARPYDVSSADMEKALASGQAKFYNPKANKAKEEKYNSILSLLANAGNSMSFGLADEGAGIVEGAKRGIEHLLGENNYPNIIEAVRGGYNTGKNETKQMINTMRQESPTASTIGQVAGMVPQMVAPGAGAAGIVGTKGLSAVKGILPSSVGQGALQGYGESEGSLGDQLSGTAFGAGVGLAGGLAAKGLGVIPGALQSLKTNQALKGLGAERSAIRQLGLGGTPVENKRGAEVAEYALKQGLVNPLDSSLDKMSNVGLLKQSLGSQLGEMRAQAPSFRLKDIVAQIDANSGVNPFNRIESEAAQSLRNVNKDLEVQSILSDMQAASPNLLEVLRRNVERDPSILNKMKLSPAQMEQATISPQQLFDYKSKLFDVNRSKFGETLDPSLEQARRAIGQVEKNVMNQVSGTEYGQLLNDYSKASTVEELLKRQLQKEAGNSVMGMGGQIGSAAGLGAALASGNPAALLAALPGIPAVRNKAALSAATGIQAGQDLPKYLGSKLNEAVSVGLEGLPKSVVSAIEKIPVLKKAVSDGKISPERAAVLLKSLKGQYSNKKAADVMSRMLIDETN